jgi:hypothetical protein
MNGFWKTVRIVGMAAFTLGALTTSARANPVLDFKTGLADEGGTVLLFSDGNTTGSGIPIGKFAAPTVNSGYIAGGNATSSSGEGYGALDGYLQSAGVSSSGLAVTRTSGTTGTSSNRTPIIGTTNGLGNGGGWGRDSPLGPLVGLSTDLQYTFLGWSTTTDPLAVGTPGTRLGTDVRNTAVPEPGSIFLLGSGLLYAAGSVRRRFNL